MLYKLFVTFSVLQKSMIHLGRRNGHETFIKYLVLSFIVIAVGACMHDEDEEEGVDGGITGVDNSAKAESVVEQLADGVIGRNLLDQISSGVSYSDHTVSGSQGGSASVSGLEYYSGQVDCGSSCVESTYEVTITVVFNGYKVMSSDNVVATVTGTVNYYEYSYSRQSGLSYSSSKSLNIDGNSVQVSFIPTDIVNWGYVDTISFSASGKTAGLLSGSVTTAGGANYTF